jgi:hypothetical protein
MSRTDEFQDQIDEEKAAALEAAIEYEDRLEGGTAEVAESAKEPERAGTASSAVIPLPQMKGTSMEAETEESLLKGLIEVVGRIEKDKIRLRELCRAVGAGAPAEPGLQEARAVRNAAARAPRKKLPGAPEYWKKVKCPVCSEIKGSRVYESVRYPVLHKNAETGETCKGSFQPGGEIGGD